MVERIKNKKGFTIIEMMVVIALIGILAAVLVPKFGGVKDRARDAGMLTNAKMVEAYVASAIDSYKTTEYADLVAAITTQFSGDNVLTNPYNGTSVAGNINVSAIDVGAYSSGITTSGSEDDDAGIIYVVIDDDTLDVYINGFDVKGNQIKATQRTITK